MPTIHLRVTGTRDAFDTVLSAIEGVDQVDRVEEIDDLMNEMRDDSSSSEMSDDTAGSTTYVAEIQAPKNRLEQVRITAEATAMNMEAALEFLGPDDDEMFGREDEDA
ncbi:hypothetical protein EC912_10193 [Luteibacter rhizovicinus]|uniref:Uncharacterized protein n=1 Tax=Luteibacter rhizovicinus TaxID=242606 RepID=A0A4R3YYZ4_9GAMM|nr:hypothetical protein [Luteibacter rhizovicinus]TCV97098.1 hypothetical protein EC912_10193 [Luteibacter rhizovicinus]